MNWSTRCPTSDDNFTQMFTQSVPTLHSTRPALHRMWKHRNSLQTDFQHTKRTSLKAPHKCCISVYITCATLASIGISCHRVCLSVTSGCSTETAIRRSRKQCRTIAQGLVFRCQKSEQNSNGLTSSGGTKCRWDRLNAGVVATNWPLLTRSGAT